MSPELRELLSDVERLDDDLAEEYPSASWLASLSYRARKILRAEDDRFACWRELFPSETVNPHTDSCKQEAL